MRLLHLSLGSHQAAQSRALRDISDFYLGVDWKQINDWNSFQETVKSFSPTHTFMQIQSKDIPIEVIDSIPGMKFNWTGDVRCGIPKFYYDYAELPNVVSLFCSKKDAEEFSKTHKADWLDIGFDNNIFSSVGVYGEELDVVFFGNNYPKRFPLSDLRLQMVQSLMAQTKWSFGLFGKGWSCFNKDIPDLNTNPWAEASIYRASRVAINLSHFGHFGYSSDRIYRITGCGGAVCAAFENEGIGRMFQPNTEILCWKTIPQLFDKIEYALGNFMARKIMANNSRITAHSRHTWGCRAAEFYRLTQKWSSHYDPRLQ